jgi:carbonic anhydrase/acetyltransferase-like protein (isoleucine patch superfamily)
MIQRYGDKTPRIHPTAWVHPAATVIGDVELGPHVSVWPGVVLRGDCGLIRIGAWSNLQDGTVVHTTQGLSETHIGQRVTVGHSVVLHGCRVDDDCLIGMHATLLDNSAVGAFSIVAAGALLTVGKQFAPRSMIMGSPAQVTREVNDKNLAQIDYGWKAYLGYREPFMQGQVETLPDKWTFWPNN